jgi:hypothetical protein
MAAPLQGVATAEPGAVERRAHVRWRTSEVNARLHLGGRTEPCRLKDISAGGAGLYPDFVAAIGEQTVLELSPRCSLPGQVVRVGRDAIGIKFAIEPALKARIEELIGLGLGPSDW